MDPNVIAELLNRYTRYPKQKRHDYISLALIDALVDYFEADDNFGKGFGLCEDCDGLWDPTWKKCQTCHGTGEKRFDRAEFVRIATSAATPPGAEAAR